MLRLHTVRALGCGKLWEVASFGQLPRGRRLQSWKEIADHLGVTVRSAQRWEKTAGLPVHRLGRGRSARVVAFSNDLDEWMRTGGPRNAPPGAAPLPVDQRRKRPLWPAAAAVAAGVGALVLVLFRLLAPGDPHSWTLTDGVFTVRDPRGRVCWRKQFPGLQRSRAVQGQPLVQIADLDGDARPEILFNFVPADRRRSRAALHCYEHDGALRWEFRYGAEKTFGGRTFEPEFHLQAVRLVRNSGRAHLITVANHLL